MSRRPSDVSADVVRALNAGERETANLAEALAMDFAALMRTIAGVEPAAVSAMRRAAGLGVTRRMSLAAELLDGVDPAVLAGHPSDTVRGWACYAIGRASGPSLPERLSMIRPLADDHHFGVREWAWLGVRGTIVAEPLAAIASLSAWTGSASESLRRFASEATRPRGVWSAHIAALKDDPGPGLEVLEPLRADPSRYVQDSVGNWLNDAAKGRPAWARGVCARWMTESPCAATARIVRRGLRSVGGAG